MNILVYGMDFRDFVRKKYTNHSIRFKSIVSFFYNFRIRLLIKGRKWNRRLYIYIYIWIFDHRDARSILREVEGKSGEGVEN